jgi:hypothetical protein
MATKKSVKFSSGVVCERPEGFTLGDWKKLLIMLDKIGELERKMNTRWLKMPKDEYDAGKRYTHLEFDCPSLTHLKGDGDKGRKKEILALLGNEARDPAMIAHNNDMGDDFKAAVKKLVIGAHASDKERDMRVTLKDGVLKISRVTFQGGGWTGGDWVKFFENNL